MAPRETTRPQVQRTTRSRDTLSPGTLAGNYVIGEVLGSGGCGTVYRATHREMGRQAALKVLHRDVARVPEMVERFVREARAVNMIRHPNIVDIYDLGKLGDGRPYSVMELIEGSSLDEVIRRDGSLWPREVVDIFEPLCSALHAAHELGVVHRDLKASNVLLGTGSGKTVLKLLDFGIAKLMMPENESDGLSSMSWRLGSPYAMAPEQIVGGAVDRRTDVYALGVLLFQLLTGRYPFDAVESAEVERMHVQSPVPRPSKLAPVSPRFDALVARCMEKERSARFATVIDVLAELRATVAGVTVAVSPTPRSCSALAIYVETHLAADALDDASIDDLTAIMELVAERLTNADFAIALETGSSLMGVLLLDEEHSAAPLMRRTLDTARALEHALLERSNPDPRVRVGITVHRDRAVTRPSTRNRRVIGGPIVQIESWAPRHGRAGVHVTTEFGAE